MSDPNPDAIKSLQAFFLSRMNKINNCDHKTEFRSPPGEPEFIVESCLCEKIHRIHLSPKLAADFAAASELKDPTFNTELQDGKIIKLFGLDVVITNPGEKHGKNN